MRDNQEASRYELVHEGEMIGHARYRIEDGRLVVPYVEVDPRHGGRGYGSTLCAGLIDDARARGLAVVPLCSFLAWYMDRNPV